MKNPTESTLQYPFSYRDAVEILKLIESTEHCQSLKMSVGDISISMTRASQDNGSLATRQTATTPASQNTVPISDTSTTSPAKPAGPDAHANNKTEKIIVPTLGVFYRAPAPDAEPFIEVGDYVKPDTQIGLLEVMKLYMPITAGVAGHVTEILVADGELVEHEQVLMLVDTD